MDRDIDIEEIIKNELGVNHVYCKYDSVIIEDMQIPNLFHFIGSKDSIVTTDGPDKFIVQYHRG